MSQDADNGQPKGQWARGPGCICLTEVTTGPRLVLRTLRRRQLRHSSTPEMVRTWIESSELFDLRQEDEEHLQRWQHALRGQNYTDSPGKKWGG